MVCLSAEEPDGGGNGDLECPGGEGGGVSGDWDETRVETDSVGCRVGQEVAGGRER